MLILLKKYAPTICLQIVSVLRFCVNILQNIYVKFSKCIIGNRASVKLRLKLTFPFASYVFFFYLYDT